MTVFTKITVEGTEHRDDTQITLGKSTSDDNSTSRLTINYDNVAGRNKSGFNTGDEIILFAEKDVNPPTTKLFAGTISEIRFEGKGPRERMIVAARDFSSLLQKSTVEPEVFTNQTIEFIVKDLIDKYAPSDFTVNNVQDTGKTLTRITFKQISVFDSIRKLAELASFFFFVDEDKDLHFEPRDAVASGETLDENNVIKSQFREDADSVRNRIFVYGDRTLVAHPTETFTGDGVGSVFTLDTNPHNTKVVVSGTFQVGDIFKGDTASVESGVNYLVSFQDLQIIFVSGTDLGYNSIPPNNHPVVVDYQQSRPIIKLAEDQVSIAKFDRRTEVILDESIQDPREATDRAKAELALRSNPAVQGTIDTQGLAFLTPGNTVIVNLPFENQNNNTYNILEANYTFNVNTTFSERVLKVKVSRRIKDLTDVIKELLLNVKELQATRIDDTGILSRLTLATGSVGLRNALWKVKQNTITTSFVLGHPLNGVMGSPAPAQGGGQVVMGDNTTAFVITVSGIQVEAI